MKKFKSKVETIDTYTIEIDENIMDEEWMKDFREYFFEFHSLEEHAEHIAECISRFGHGFIEGYGIPLKDGEVPGWLSKERMSSVNRGINIIYENHDIYVDVDNVE